MNRRNQAPAAKVSELDLVTLATSVAEHVRPSYLPALRRCVDAGLVVFDDCGRGAPRLTDAGRKALAAVQP